MNIPVKYKDIVIGYTPDEGKTIVFDNSETAKQLLKTKFGVSRPIYISSRSYGKIDENGRITNTELTDLSIF